ncbi:MAG: fumarylacetoacetate hydrolase family protein [Candidatus Heimdallarchaeota archaeon]
MKILCIGLNYIDHAKEMGRPLPKHPFVFAKASSSVIGDGEPIIIPQLVKFVDYEVELAVIIGSSAKNVKKENAFDYIRGYTIANDVTGRDIYINDPRSFFIAKSFDTFCPLGPQTVLKTDLRDPHSLKISLRVNGETRQTSNTQNLIFKIPDLISWISQRMTLKADDVILTGTPAGVGFARKPPVPLKQGDEIEAEIEGIGILRNPVIIENA